MLVLGLEVQDWIHWEQVNRQVLGSLDVDNQRAEKGLEVGRKVSDSCDVETPDGCLQQE